MRVTVFCGGRGSATIRRELLRWSDVQLALLVNAYDDGLSTGALRDFVPGMLGPSDFRKNISYLLDLYSSEQYAVQGLLEYRLSKTAPEPEVAGLERFSTCAKAKDVPGRLGEMLGSLEAEMLEQVSALLATFFSYAKDAPSAFA